MQSKAKITGISKNIITGEFNILLATKTLGDIEELRNCEVDVEIKKHYQKRSLDANAYFWVLLDKLALETGTPKEKIYIEYIRNVGGNSKVICARSKDVDDIIQSWKHNGLGWVCDTDKSKLDNCTNIILYSGSSTYTTKQMSRLIDMAVQDCRALGIETMTPQAIEQMLGAWDK